MKNIFVHVHLIAILLQYKSNIATGSTQYDKGNDTVVVVVVVVVDVIIAFIMSSLFLLLSLVIFLCTGFIRFGQ